MTRARIWKLQRPLATNMELLEVMAYTEGRKSMAMIPLPQEFIDELFGDELKIYVKAKVTNGVLKVKRRVPEQEW